jgi:hypothetical protein
VTPRYLVIANPGTPRAVAYERELREFWSGHEVEIVLVPWAKLIAAQGRFEALPEFDKPAFVKIESPGKSDEVAHEFLKLGQSVRNIPFQAPPWPKGLLVEPGLQHLGFEILLDQMQASSANNPHLMLSAQPEHIRVMFNKTTTSNCLRDAGISVPYHLPHVPPLSSPFISNLPYFADWFIKLNSGSSAVGIGVYHGSSSRMTTTVLHKPKPSGEAQFCSSRKLINKPISDLYETLDWLLAQGVIVQEGVRGAKFDSHKFDVRFICYYGEVVAWMFRLSQHPITNLHLGGVRGDEASCRAKIPRRAWLDARDAASSAAECFDSSVCGVDLIFEEGYARHFILEVNAFGDFFPGITTTDGIPLRQVEIGMTAKRLGFV